MADDKKSSQISLTAEQLQTMVQTVVQAAVDTVHRANGYVPPPSADQLKPAPVERTYVTVRSETGAVIKWALERGVIVEHEGPYPYPDGVDVKISDGGLSPHEIDSVAHKHWKWVEFWQRDLRTYVGRDAAYARRISVEVLG